MAEDEPCSNPAGGHGQVLRICYYNLVSFLSKALGFHSGFSGLL